MRSSRFLALAGSVYRLLQRSYPAAFRRRYGEELFRIFEERGRAALATGGGLRLVRYWTGALWDVVRNGLAERYSPLGRIGEPRTGRRSLLLRGEMMSELVRDVRHGIRALVRSPGFAVAAVLTIGLGIGANTAIFSVVSAVLLKPLPFAEPDRLVLIWGEMTQRNVRNFPLSPPDFLDLGEMSTTLDDVAGVVTFAQPLSGDGEPVQVDVGGVTTNFFSLLGVRPALGRDFVEADGAPTAPGLQPGDPGFANTIAILSHALWQDRYGGDPSVVGRIIDIGGGPAEIVGVMPRDFRLLMPEAARLAGNVQLWTAMRLNFATADRNNVFLRVVGRLSDGASVPQAQQDVDRIAAEHRANYPIKATAGHEYTVIQMHDDLVAPVRPIILALLGAVVFVLLIACANVGNLLLVRSSARERELAVRSAVGGSRSRLIRQMLIESLLLSVGGGLVGVGLAAAGIRVLGVLQPDQLPRTESIGLDPLVLAYTALAVVVSALIFGMIPALRASRPGIAGALREGGRSPGLKSNRVLRNGVIIAEVALSLVLLIGAGLMVRTFVALQQVDPGFEAEGVLTFNVPLPFARYPQAEQRNAFSERLHERLTALPGVEAVTASTPLPLDGQLLNGRWGLQAALSDPQAFRQADYFFALPDFFETLETELIAGRTFDWADHRDSAAVVVVDEKLAAMAFPGQSAVGERILVRVTTPEAVWVEIIGVVRHQRHISLASEGRETIYFTDAYAGGFGGLTWAVRTAGDPIRMAAVVRAEVAAVDPLVPVADIRPFSDYVDAAMAETRFALTLIGVFAAIALALATIGLYGVLAFVVRQRTAEIGVRMAFGARETSILRLIVGQGVGLSAIGALLGVLGAIALTRVMSSLLIGVTATDPLTFLAITGLFMLVAVLASLIPALRASRVDPIQALRQE